MNKLNDAICLLEQSINEFNKNPNNKVIAAGVIKSFEICFEYVWKAFKKMGNEAGNEIYNPRDAIKTALEMGLIEDFEKWKIFLNSRNLSVHDYLGVADQEIIEVSKQFFNVVKNIKWQ